MKELYKRDFSVDLLRVAACFLVIMTHIRLPLYNPAGPLRRAVVLMNCIVAPAVGIFFMIAGFFMYREGRRFFPSLFHFLKKILLPAMLTALIGMILKEWLFDRTDLWSAISSLNLKYDIEQLSRGIVSLDAFYWGETCGHLWYVLDYAQLILMFPFMAVLIRNANDRILLYAAGFSIIRAMLMDINNFHQLPVEVFLTSYFPVCQFYAIAGYLLYKNREKLKKPVVTAVTLGMYAAVLGVMLVSELQYIRVNQVSDFSGMYYSTLHSGTGQLMAFILTAFVLSLSWITDKAGKFLRLAAAALGDLTFYIYLVHFMIILKLRANGFELKFAERTYDSVHIVLYYLIYGLFIFLVSAIASAGIKQIRNFLSSGFEKILPAQR